MYLFEYNYNFDCPQKQAMYKKILHLPEIIVVF